MSENWLRLKTKNVKKKKKTGGDFTYWKKPRWNKRKNEKNIH